MHHIVTTRILNQYGFQIGTCMSYLKLKTQKYTWWTGPQPVKPFIFCYLTYGSRIANRMDFPYQTVMGQLGTLTGENPLLLFPANFQGSTVSGARRRAASVWLAEETRFPKTIPSVTVQKAACFIIQFLKRGVESICILSTTKLLKI